MVRWEYRVLSDVSAPELNDLGDDGWEIVAVEWDDEGEILNAFAKRPRDGGGGGGNGGGGNGGGNNRRRRRPRKPAAPIGPMT